MASPILTLGVRHLRLRGHVAALSSSHDGTRLAASCDFADETAVFELPSGRTLMRASEPADHLFLTPDGKTLIAAFARLKVWTVDGGQAWDEAPFEDLQRPIAFCARTGLVAATRGERTVVLLLLAAPGEHRIVHESTAPIRSLALSADGAWLAVGSDSTCVELVRVSSGQRRSLPRQTLEHPCVAFTPDSSLVVTGGDGPVLLWPVSSGRSPRELAPDLRAARFAFSPDGSRLAVRSFAGTLRVIDVATAVTLWGREIHFSDPAVTFVGAGDTIAVGAQAKALLLSATTGEPRAIDDDPFDEIRGIAVSHDGRHAATASRDTSVVLWDLATGARLQKLGNHDSYALCVAFSPDGDTVASGGADGTVRLWRAAPDAGASARSRRPALGRADITSIAYSPDGTWLATLDVHGALYHVDAQTLEHRLLLAGRRDDHERLCVDFLPDGTLVASVADEVVFVDAAKGQILHRMPTTRPALAVSRRHSKIAIATEGTVRVLRLPSLETIASFGVGLPVAVAFGPEGEIAIAEYDGAVQIHRLDGHSDRVLDRKSAVASSLAFADDGRLVIGTADGTSLVFAASRASRARSDGESARDVDERVTALLALLDAFQRGLQGAVGGYRGAPPRSERAGSELEIVVPISGGAARIRWEISDAALLLVITVGVTTDTPPDVIPKAPLERARRWVRDRLSTEGRRDADAAFVASLPSAPGLQQARLYRNPLGVALAATLSVVPQVTWLEDVVTAIATRAR